MAEERQFEVSVEMGPGLDPLPATFRPYFASSFMFMVDYDLPFSLNVEPTKQGVVVVTKDGKAGEEVGDVLRAVTTFRQDMQNGGVAGDILSFAGAGLKWQKALFDTTGTPFLFSRGQYFLLLLLSSMSSLIHPLDTTKNNLSHPPLSRCNFHARRCL
jgi:hypothetical protein